MCIFQLTAGKMAPTTIEEQTQNINLVFLGTLRDTIPISA